ncbi:MAG TPA: hypothetical protein VFW70_04140 [Methylomirabilota bacterium]|jgi:hypothetical protein|nr:hypothetical protein [Methylomirabilota bacterium]
MQKRLTAVFAALAVVAFVSTASAQETKVELKAQSNSNETGTATLTPAGDSTKVTLEVKGAEGTQPTHIHKGTCDKLDPKPAYPLSPVVNGKSETTVKASIKDLTSGQYAINGHKSAQDLKTYVFCGEIKS